MKVCSEPAFPKLTVASSVKEAQIAVGATEKLPLVLLFRWRAYAVAINATSQQNGSWVSTMITGQGANGQFLALLQAVLEKGHRLVRVMVEDGVARVEE